MTILKNLKSISLIGSSLALISGLSLSGAIAQAAPTTTSTSNTTSKTVNQQTDLNNIKSKGATEITRRLNSLKSASSKISTTTKLSSSDQASLESEVNTEISGLTNLQAQLAADTTVTQARTDAQTIFTEYRVYALVLPKILLVTTADNQQTTQSKLTTLAQQLQSRITADQNAGKNVTTLQTELNDMNTQVSNGQAISSSIEQKVLTLQPGDYDTDHTILSGDNTQLKTAHSDDEAAYTDAKNITNSLKNL